MRLCE
jgi:hypothetical protein